MRSEPPPSVRQPDSHPASGTNAGAEQGHRPARRPTDHYSRTKHIEQATERFDRLTDALDPDTAEIEDLGDLRAVATASQAVQDDEARLQHAVQVARQNGRSWNHLATALGVSRQAARQRFADKVHN